MTKSILCFLTLGVLSGCTSLSAVKELERAYDSNAQLLEQQVIRMELQGEYLEQLAESQQEVAETLDRVSRQVAQVNVQMAETAGKQPAQNSIAPRTDASAQPTGESLEVAVAAAEKQVVGRNEWVWLELLKRNLKARVDTGALSSSLSAIDLLPFDRDGQEWIRFRVPDEDHPDGGDVYEAPLVKHVRIRQASADELERRPVIRLTVRLGDLVDEAEFNLTNRQDMLYPVLLGRNFLRDIAVVDVAQKFVQRKYVPDAPESPKEI